MTDEMTLTQLAAEISQLRQQIETIQQRLDMIYGAVTRLSDQMAASGSPPSRPKTIPLQGASPPGSLSEAGRQPGPELSATAMMDPGGMLDALHQYAIKVGLDVSKETVERLKAGDKAEEEASE